MNDNSKMIAAIRWLTEGISRCPGNGSMHIADDMQFISNPDLVLSSESHIGALDYIMSDLTGASRPLQLVQEKDGSINLSIGGLPVDPMDVSAIDNTLTSLQMLEDILPEPQRNGDTEMYIFGQPGAMHPNDRMLAVWARSPIEAYGKFHAYFQNDFHERPAGEIPAEIMGLDIEMRSQHDWARHDVADLSARFRDEQVLYAETDKNPEQDSYFGFE
jgi:hypothetical protein